MIARNYLEVYVYERWSDKEIIDYEDVAEFEPSAIELAEGSTSAPNLLTEADLVRRLVPSLHLRRPVLMVSRVYGS